MKKNQVSPDAVDRLDLAYRDINEINPSIVERFGPYVKELDLSNNNLEKDLTILEGFKRLNTLVLDHNKITHHIKFPILPQLTTLWINSNLISNLSSFIDKVIESFPNIRTFSMLKNDACPNFFNGHSLREYKDYRMYIISKLKNIQILDSTPVTAEERIDAFKLYGNLASITQSLAAATPKPLPLQVDIVTEDDPKKKREEKLKATLAEKEERKKQRSERREKRRLKALEKEEKQFKKAQEKLQQQQDTDSTITNKDDFTSDEDESGNEVIKKSKINKSLPIYSTEQSPATTILPPIPHKQSAYDSLEIADDEAFSAADSSDHSDLPLYKNNSNNNITAPPPKSLLLPKSNIIPPPPPPPFKKQSNHHDNDDDDDDDSDDDSDQPPQKQPHQQQLQNDDDDDDDDDDEDESQSSEWSSGELDDEDDNEVNEINSKLPTKLTIRDQYYQQDDDDDSDEDDDQVKEFTHFPVRPPIKK